MTKVVIHLAECEPEQHPDWVKTTHRAAVADGGELCGKTAYMDGELFPDEEVWAQTADTAEPLGFQPRSSIRPLWLHTIELDADQALAGAVVVVRMADFTDLADLVDFVAGTNDGSPSCVLKHTPGEAWVRLTRQQAIALRQRLGDLVEDTSPFGDDQYDAYSSLTLLDNIVEDEAN